MAMHQELGRLRHEDLLREARELHHGRVVESVADSKSRYASLYARVRGVLSERSPQTALRPSHVRG